MNKPVKVIMFGNGNTACFDEYGQQIAELQQSWFLLYCELLKKNGFDPTEVEFDLPMGNATVFKCGDESETENNQSERLIKSTTYGTCRDCEFNLKNEKSLVSECLLTMDENTGGGLMYSRDYGCNQWQSKPSKGE